MQCQCMYWKIIPIQCSGTHEHIKLVKSISYRKIQSVPKKMSFLGKIAITTFKLIQNAKAGGVLENSEYLLPDGHWDFQNWRRNDWENEAWSCQPPFKNLQNSLLTLCTSLIFNPLHFHDLQWKQNLFHTFENLSAHFVANILNFPKHPQLLHFGWVWR